jgi:hypothetical protein
MIADGELLDETVHRLNRATICRDLCNNVVVTETARKTGRAFGALAATIAAAAAMIGPGGFTPNEDRTYRGLTAREAVTEKAEGREQA